MCVCACVCACVCVCVCERVCGVSVIVKRSSLPPCAVSRRYWNPLLLLLLLLLLLVVVVVVLAFSSVQSRLLLRACTCKVEVQITLRQTVSVLDGGKVEESVRQSDAILHSALCGQKPWKAICSCTTTIYCCTLCEIFIWVYIVIPRVPVRWGVSTEGFGRLFG